MPAAEPHVRPLLPDGRRRTSVVAHAIFIIAGLGLILFAPLLEHTRHKSADGQFVVVVRTPPIYRFVATMPGGGSDRPARATLYRDGKSCGSLALPMASFVYDLQWVLDATPRRAEIKFAGTWDLDACRVSAF